MVYTNMVPVYLHKSGKRSTVRAYNMASLASAPELLVPDLPVRGLSEDAEDSTIMTLAAGKKLVMDCWTTRCERCPAALAKLDDFAREYNKADEVRPCT